jgi:hypothetical protein
VYERISASVLDEAILDAALTSLGGVPGVGEVDVVVAGDLEASIRQRLSEDAAAGFAVERVTGSVGAKTIHRDDGSSIVIDGRLLIQGAARAADIDVSRLLAHEGWHVSLRNRGEDFNTAAERHDVSGAWGHFLGQALIVIEEFRVERALCEQGLPLHRTYEQTTSLVLEELRAALVEAVTLRAQGGDICRTYDSAVRAFNALTIHFAYLAADYVASGGSRSIGSVRDSIAWTRYVNSNWAELVRRLEPIPAASDETGAATIDIAAGELAEVLQGWMKDVGFDLYDVPGGLYFDVLSNDF